MEKNNIVFHITQYSIHWQWQQYFCDFITFTCSSMVNSFIFLFDQCLRMSMENTLATEREKIKTEFTEVYEKQFQHTDA